MKDLEFTSPKILLLLCMFLTCCTCATPAIKSNHAPQEFDMGFLVFGDSGTGSRHQYRVAAGIEKFCQTNKCDFTCLLGDNIYAYGVEDENDEQFQTKFEKPYKNLTMPFYVALGNHDNRGSTAGQIKYSKKSKKWRLPAAYYKYQKGPIEFFVINSNKFDQDQKTWLKKELSISKAKYKIVYGHHPVFSFGYHGDTENLKEHLLPVLNEYNVLAYLAGHDHDKQLLSKEKIKTWFIISGASAKLRPEGRGKQTLFAKSTRGFAWIGVKGDQFVLKFLNEDGLLEYEKTLARPAIIP